MSSITPRWEWRTFGESFHDVERQLGDLRWIDKSTDETYIVGDSSHVNAKIRDGRLEIKVLQATDPNGLERWQPLAAESFPLMTAMVASMFSHLRIGSPRQSRAEYSQECLLRELQTYHGLAVVAVRKQRATSRFAGCLVELSDVWFDGEPTCTFAIEHEDASTLTNVLSALGLLSQVNTNYIRALQQHLVVRGYVRPLRRQGDGQS